MAHSAKTAYLRCKERLIGITVDLDDRTKEASLLVEAIDREREVSRSSLDSLRKAQREDSERRNEEHQRAMQEVGLVQDSF